MCVCVCVCVGRSDGDAYTHKRTQVAPLRALRNQSFVMRQDVEHGADAGGGYPFKVGAGKGEIEDVGMIYARTLMVTQEDFKRLKMKGLLEALAGCKEGAVSQENEKMAQKLMKMVLRSQMQSMLRLSTVEEDAALLARLEGVGNGAGPEREREALVSAGSSSAETERGGNAGGAREAAMPNLLMCVRYRLARKRLLMSAIASLEDEVWKNVSARSRR